MNKPIEITRFDLTATELRELAARTQDGAMVRRLLAIALVLEGYPREAAAQLNLLLISLPSSNPCGSIWGLFLRSSRFDCR